MYCQNCGKELRPDAKFCDGCGTKVGSTVIEEIKNEKPSKIEIKDVPKTNSNNQTKGKTYPTATVPQVIFGFILFAILMFFMFSSIGEKPTSSISKNTSVTNVVEKVKAPLEHRNALAKAQFYSDKMYMSKKGLYQQLTSQYGEGFTKDAAQYAIDNVKADYKRNALKKAEFYATQMHMSRRALFDQLCSEYGEQFTREEAQYAIDHMR